MNKFEHLANLVLEDTREGKRNKTKAEELKDLKGEVIRIYKNGEVYPSTELVEKFNLHYQNENSPNSGNGFDIVDSLEWKPTAELPRMVLVGAASKSLPKVDLFAGVRHNEQGESINSVLEQGTKSFLLLNLVRAMGWMTDSSKYVDLRIVTEFPINTKDGISYLPKFVERGKKKDERTYERRENITFYPLDIVSSELEINEETAINTVNTKQETTQTVTN